MQIRIYLDGTFESIAASYSFATDKERRDRIKVLQGDLKLMDKVEALRVTREANKKTIAGLPKGPQKEKARAKDKEILAKIKELKAKLTSPRHSSSKIIGGMIRQTMDTVVGGKTIGQIAKEGKIKVGGKQPAAPTKRRVVRENKPHPVHDKIRPGDKVAKAESREMEQLMADLPEAKANYRKMPKSANMQKARDNAKKMIDAMEKRLDMLKAKYIGSAKK